MRIFWVILFLGTSLLLSGQNLSGIAARWNDSFVEWDIYCVTPGDTLESQSEEHPEETRCGELRLRWLDIRDDFSEWDFELYGERGTIKQKWKDDPTNWELRAYSGTIVSMRATWPNDFTEWRITDNDVTINWRSRWKNQYDEWFVEDRTKGNFYVNTVYARDPRDWNVYDELDNSVSDAMRLAMVFIAAFMSSPKQ